jgi:hypothetical protein
MSSNAWTFGRTAAKARRKPPPKRPKRNPVAPAWYLLACLASQAVHYGIAARTGDFGLSLIFAAAVLLWSWWLHRWWRWRQWCKHSGEAFPRYGPADFVFMAVNAVAVVWSWWPT